MSHYSKLKKSGAKRGRVYPKRSTKMATKSYVKKAIAKASESKFLDTSLDLAAAIFTHTPVAMALIAEGPGENERIGLSVFLDSYHLKWQIKPNASTPTLANCNIRLFQWYDTTDPTTTAISLSSGTKLMPIAMNNVTTNKGKFKILMNECFPITLSGAGSQTCGERFFKLKGKAQWSTSASTSETNAGGQIWIQLTSDVGTNGPLIQINSRLRWHE